MSADALSAPELPAGVVAIFRTYALVPGDLTVETEIEALNFDSLDRISVVEWVRGRREA